MIYYRFPKGLAAPCPGSFRPGNTAFDGSNDSLAAAIPLNKSSNLSINSPAANTVVVKLVFTRPQLLPLVPSTSYAQS